LFSEKVSFYLLVFINALFNVVRGGPCFFRLGPDAKAFINFDFRAAMLKQ
jgi:hypothetical protein